MQKFVSIALLVIGAVACSRGEHVQPAAAKAPPAATATTASAAPAGQTSAPASGGTAVGSPMPAYQAQTFDGKSFDLATERGEVVLLNLWATWCPPCRGEIPDLQKMHDRYSGQGFKVIGVSLDDSGTDTVKKFVADHKMTYPVLLDPEGKLANIFQTSVVPTSVLIDRYGKIVWKQFGQIDPNDAEMQKALTTALAEKKG